MNMYVLQGYTADFLSLKEIFDDPSSYFDSKVYVEHGGVNTQLSFGLRGRPNQWISKDEQARAVMSDYRMTFTVTNYI